MTQSTDTVLASIKKKQFSPLYLFHGDEPYFIELLTNTLEELVVPSHEKSFNQFVLFGKDLTIGGLLGYAKKFPMMAERQLILVKDAQQIQGIDNKDQTKYLEDYLKNPLPSTVLAFSFGSPVDERKTWVKAFEKNGVVVSSKKMYENKLPDWIADYCHQKGVKISPKAIQMLVEFIGNDLKRLANEIEKILLNLTVKQEIAAETIEKFVGVSKDYNIFEFQKSLIQKDGLKANRIINYFAINQKDNPLPATLIMLYNFFSKLLVAHASPDKSEGGLASTLGIRPFFVKDYLMAMRAYSIGKNVRIISYLREADARSKGVESGGMTEGDILKELVFKILH
jgi:DNA polymerase III subunit delta